MPYAVLLHPKAARAFTMLPTIDADRVKTKLREMIDDPRRNADRLSGSPYWKRRVGDYRVIYEINDESLQVIVLFVGHGKNVYDDFSKLV